MTTNVRGNSDSKQRVSLDDATVLVHDFLTTYARPSLFYSACPFAAQLLASMSNGEFDPANQSGDGDAKIWRRDLVWSLKATCSIWTGLSYSSSPRLIPLLIRALRRVQWYKSVSVGIMETGMCVPF